jgi:hypothetical protein
MIQQSQAVPSENTRTLKRALQLAITGNVNTQYSYLTGRNWCEELLRQEYGENWVSKIAGFSRSLQIVILRW